MQIKPWDNIRIYKVEHTLKVKESLQVKESRITFDMGISCNIKNGSIRKLFTRENCLINSKIPKEHHIRLLYELEQAIYPLEIEVNRYGNYEKIPGYALWFSNWQNKAEKILKENYRGEFAESLKNQLQENLETEEKLKQKIQEEAFWRLYFFGMQNAQNDKTLRWNVLKAGTLYFTGDVQTSIEENKLISVYGGKSEKPEESFTENLNILLRKKKNSKHYLMPGNIEASGMVKSVWEKDIGKLLYKASEIEVNSEDKNYLYSEKIEMKYQGISIRKETNPKSFIVSRNK